jgi:hypothetical protein
MISINRVDELSGKAFDAEISVQVCSKQIATSSALHVHHILVFKLFHPPPPPHTHTQFMAFPQCRSITAYDIALLSGHCIAIVLVDKSKLQ